MCRGAVIGINRNQRGSSGSSRIAGMVGDQVDASLLDRAGVFRPKTITDHVGVGSHGRIGQVVRTQSSTIKLCARRTRRTRCFSGSKKAKARFIFDEEPMESVTHALNVKFPALPGVPVMAPVCEFITSPPGKAPDASDH